MNNKSAAIIGVVIICIAAMLLKFSPVSPAPSATVKATLALAEKTIKAADTKIAAATVQVKHVKAIVKVKAKVAAAKLVAYEEIKKSVSTPHLPSPSQGEGEGGVPNPEPIPAPPPAIEIIVAADEALDAAHAENFALQEETASLETVVEAHGEKEAALEQEQRLYAARVADLEKENTRLESNLFWTHVAIGVAVVVAAAGGFYLMGFF